MGKSAAPALNPMQDLEADEQDSRSGFRISLFAHVGLFLALFIKSIVLPGDPLPIPPSLRVDIVGLPDQMKKDLVAVPPAPQEGQKAEPAKAKPVAQPKAPEAEPAARPDEMVRKSRPKSRKDALRESLKKLNTHESVKREKKLKSALDRIKALSRISEEERASTPGVLIKGNRISKGASLSADARESLEASYYDALRAHLQDNWALPVWLARQQLSAQVQLFIDPRGRIANFRFARSSGSSQFDDQVKRALQESQPFPAPPGDIAGSLAAKGVLIGFPL